MKAVDTNVFIYSLDTHDLVKQGKAQALLAALATDSTVLPWQVAVEILANLRKRESAGRISSDELQVHFRDFLSMFPLVIPNAQMIPTYFALRARFSLSHWDTMLLAACKDAGVSTLYSEDLAAGMNYDGVVVVNPFL
jgi:predicted nucleic acid-binding protein